MEEAASPTLSAVIVNWNGGTVLLDTLKSLREHPPSVEWEAIVIDNNSSDGSLERVRREHPWARTIANDDNRGLAAANNQGILASQAPFLLICNPDIQVREHTIDRLLGVLDRRPRAAFAIARLERPDGSTQTTVGDLPTLREAVLGRQIQARRRNAASGFWWDGWSHDEERLVGHGMEACFLVRRAAVVEFGLQDEGFPLDWEGIDWSARAADAGWEIWFSPEASALHHGGVSLRQAQAAWVVRSHRGMYRYFAKRRSLAWRPVLAGIVALRAAPKLAGVALHLADYKRSHPGASDDTSPDH